MKLRVATYNIHKGVSILRGMPRVHALKQAIIDLQADLVFLQEVQGRHDLYEAQYSHLDPCGTHWPQQAQHHFFAGETFHTAYGMNAVYQHGHHGNALLSALPIAATYNRDVSAHVFEQRGILHCVLEHGGGRLHCYVVHLGLFSAGRMQQIEALIDAVQTSAPADDPLIIAGDFNDWRNQLSQVLRNRLGVIEAFDERRSGNRLGAIWRGKKPIEPQPARTFPALLPWLRLDRIYVRGFLVESAQVLSGAPWRDLSDHAPIVATLRQT